MMKLIKTVIIFMLISAAGLSAITRSGFMGPASSGMPSFGAFSFGHMGLAMSDTDIKFSNMNYGKFSFGYAWNYQNTRLDPKTVLYYGLFSDLMYGSWTETIEKTNTIDPDKPSVGFSDMLTYSLLGFTKGYGYRFNENFAIVPALQYTPFGYSLGLIQDNYSGSYTQQYREIIDIKDHFNETIYSMVSGEIQFMMFKTVSLNLGYEKYTFAPNNLKFLPYAGGIIVDMAAITVNELLTHNIFMKEAPEWAPVINFLLGNGFLFLSHELKKSDVGWPFTSDSRGLSGTSFKIGIQIVLNKKSLNY